MSGRMYKEVFTQVFAVFQTGVCKVHEQVSQGVQLWLRLLQLGMSLVSGEDYRPHRECK